MQFTSFRLQRTYRSMHTPDCLLNVFLACRVPPRQQSPGLVYVLLQGLVSAWHKAVHHTGHASR